MARVKRGKHLGATARAQGIFRTPEDRDEGGDQIEFGFRPVFRFLAGCLV